MTERRVGRVPELGMGYTPETLRAAMGSHPHPWVRDALKRHEDAAEMARLLSDVAYERLTQSTRPIPYRDEGFEMIERVMNAQLASEPIEAKEQREQTWRSLLAPGCRHPFVVLLDSTPTGRDDPWTRQSFSFPPAYEDEQAEPEPRRWPPAASVLLVLAASVAGWTGLLVWWLS